MKHGTRALLAFGQVVVIPDTLTVQLLFVYLPSHSTISGI